MPRVVSEESRELVRKLIRAGDLTTKLIAERARVGVGTVTRTRKEMGMGVEDGRATNGARVPQPVHEPDPEPQSPPSRAALALAAYDPVIARAIRGDPPPRDGRHYNGAGGGLNAKKGNSDD